MELYVNINALPKELKEVILLFIVYDKTAKDTAEILNIHRNTVYNRFHKALEKLENNT